MRVESQKLYHQLLLAIQALSTSCQESPYGHQVSELRISPYLHDVQQCSMAVFLCCHARRVMCVARENYGPTDNADPEYPNDHLQYG